MYTYNDGSKHPVPPIRRTHLPRTGHDRAQAGFGLVQSYRAKHDTMLEAARPLLGQAHELVKAVRRYDTNLPLLTQIEKELVTLNAHFNEIDQFSRAIAGMEPPARGISAIQLASQRMMLQHYLALDHAVGTQITRLDTLTRHFSTELVPFVGQTPDDKRNALFDFCDDMRAALKNMHAALPGNYRQSIQHASGHAR